jgi:CBS-domain-containing membrane protein
MSDRTHLLDDPVSAAMSRELVTVAVGQSLSDARRVLTEGSFHHVPVVSGTTVVGMLSSTDLLRVSEGCDAVPLQVDGIAERAPGLRSLMRQDLIRLNPHDTVRRACELFADGRFHAIVVVDDAGALLGLLTTTDVIRHLFGRGRPGG